MAREIIIISIIFALLSAYSCKRSLVWKDEFQLWQAVARASPEKARPHNNLGRAYEKMNLIREAKQEYAKSLGINPLYQPGLRNMAYLNLREGRLEQAEEGFLMAIRYGPEYADIRTHLGIVYLEMKRFGQAEKELKKALELDPGYEPATQNLLHLYTEWGYYLGAGEGYDAAVLRFKDALKIDENNPAANYGIALAYENMGMKDKAGTHWAIFLKADPESPFAEDARTRLRKLTED